MNAKADQSRPAYDQICGGCKKPYLFSWAKQFGTRQWRDYCSPKCEDPGRWRSAPPLLPKGQCD